MQRRTHAALRQLWKKTQSTSLPTTSVRLGKATRAAKCSSTSCRAASDGKSVTIAGDRAQKMIFDNGFSDWPELLASAGLPHTEIQPLKITYRSTRQIMKVARGVLGELDNPEEELVARDGAPVSFYTFTEMGESVAFLAEALRSLLRREPNASVALITRFPQQARAYLDALHPGAPGWLVEHDVRGDRRRVSAIGADGTLEVLWTQPPRGQ